jgi:serine/threonine-protein kinase RsbT
MNILRSETLPLQSSDDIVRARQAVRAWAVEIGFRLVDQTKIVTAASELSRNVCDHGGGGVLRMEVVEDGERKGLRLTFEDKGPGIPDLELAMKDGYSTTGGLGLGLGGAKRLVNEFHIESAIGKGTTVSVVKWV